MKHLIAAAIVGLTVATAHAAAIVGQPAPNFSAADTAGNEVSLSDFNGKTVVLEWVNPGCPFVRKHYDSGNMPATQRAATARGVVWLAVDSTAREHRDYRTPAELAHWMADHHAAATDTLMDPDGRVGRAYGARTTPHLFIVDPAGTLIYAGGIDDKPTTDPADIATATNYVDAALAESLAGKPVTAAATRPYGCSVKYAPGA
jgi:AhpC/TSA family